MSAKARIFHTAGTVLFVSFGSYSEIANREEKKEIENYFS